METIVKEICQAIDDNRLNLPPLPETCLQVRKLLQDEGCSARQLANTIATDTALAARIMKVANSALYTRHQAPTDLTNAIQRLGNGLVGSLVNGLAIMPMFASASHRSQEIETQIKQHSLKTAALAYGLCQRYKHLNLFEAYLIAMLQNIGYIAILSYQNLPARLSNDQAALTEFLLQHHVTVGSHLLRHWQFPDAMIEVQQKHGHLFRTHSNRVDYLDIIIAANVINGPIFASRAAAIPDYRHIPALQRLNISKESLDEDLQAIQPAIHEARFIFQAVG